MPHPRLRAAAVALLLAGLAGPGLAQKTPPAESPPAATASPPAASPRAAQRPAMVTLGYDELTQGQQRRVREALAGPGAPPMPAEQARQRWAGMSQVERQRAMRAMRQEGQQRPPQQRAPQAPPPAAPPPVAPAPMAPAAPAPAAPPPG